MQILCCVKQVPEKDAKLRIKDDHSWITEEGVAFALSECDRYGVEAALRLKENVGGEVVVLSVGPDRVSKAIKEVLAMGADRAIHVVGDLGQSDPSAIATVIAAAVKDENFDLILTGQQSDDLGYNAVGPVLAEKLEFSHAQIVLTLEPAGEGSLTITHELDNSLIETAEVQLPVVLGVQSGINEVRYASLKGIMGAAKKPQRKVTIEELNIPAEELASLVALQSIDIPVRTSNAEMIEGEPAEVVRILVKKLKTEAKVL